MANSANLKPVRSKKEARERGRNGGIASGVARREKRLWSEILSDLFSRPASYVAKSLPDEISVATAAAIAMARKLIATGDHQIAAFVRDTMGEKPAERVQHSTDDDFYTADVRCRKKVE
ncbi:MAG: hypothetical protein LBN28_02395 [Desulfovibrio sp.]|jgi:hypothetical protein|nr:hypothetical protein [Desulfovibrio sp.]